MLSRNLLGGCLLLACVVSCKKKDGAPAPLASATVSTAAETASGAQPSAPEPVASGAPTPTSTGSAGGGTLSAAADAQAPSAAPKGAPGADLPQHAASVDAGKKLTSSGGASLKPCCAAIAQTAQSDPTHAHRYQAAAAVCNGLAKSVSTGKAGLAAARTTLRAQLQGVQIPGGC